MVKILRIKDIVDTISLTHKFNKDMLIAINTSDVENGVMHEGTLTLVQDLKGQFKKTIKKNDILYSEIRPANRRFALVTKDDCSDYVVSTKLMVLRKKNKDVDLKYLYYCLTNQPFLDMLQRRAENRIGSFPQITFNLLSEYAFYIPLLEEQKRISNVISFIDRKIELNKRINDNLEAMAKQLYDYWFVQFDFPNEEGEPYKSSGGVMVWNEKLKHEIPQKWSDCVLGDYIGRITNGLNPRKNFVLGSGNNYYVTIRSLVGTTIDWNNCDRCDDEALSKINSRSQLQIGDIIFSAIGTIGRTYYILEEPTNWNISETSFTLRAKENVPNDFFYGMLRSNEIQIKADKAAMGSTLRCLVMDSLCSLQYIEIPSYMMKLFAAKVSPLYRQIHRNNKEIAELTKQRDELLPLLMNGQASVNSD